MPIVTVPARGDSRLFVHASHRQEVAIYGDVTCRRHRRGRYATCHRHSGGATKLW